MSKMNAFDFIVSIAMGSTLANVSLSKNVVLADGATAFVVLIVMEFVITCISVRIESFNRIIKSQPNEGEVFFGKIAERVLQNTDKTVIIYKPVQPLNTLKSLVVVVPSNAEYERGFFHWFSRLQNISRRSGLPLRIYANDKSIERLKDLNNEHQSPLSINYYQFDNWEDFLVLSREVHDDDLFVVVSSRKEIFHTPWRLTSCQNI